MGNNTKLTTGINEREITIVIKTKKEYDEKKEKIITNSYVKIETDIQPKITEHETEETSKIKIYREGEPTIELEIERI